MLHYFKPIRSTNDATDEHPRFLLDTSVEESEKEISPEELGRLALRESCIANCCIPSGESKDNARRKE